MQDRAFANPKIAWIWDTEVTEIVGSRDAGVSGRQAAHIEYRRRVESSPPRACSSPSATSRTPGVFAAKLRDERRRLPPGRRADDPDDRPGRLRLRRRHRPDLPPGGHRRRHRLPAAIDAERWLAEPQRLMTPDSQNSGRAPRQPGYRPRIRQAGDPRQPARAKLKAEQPLFPGILGYDRTVIPAIVNALLAGHDFILLGLRGQAKTRLLRALVTLLDEEIPVARRQRAQRRPAGSDLDVRPRAAIAEAGDDAARRVARRARSATARSSPRPTSRSPTCSATSIRSRRRRGGSPTPTPRSSTSASSRAPTAASSPSTSCPDLAPRIQVGLFNILEERDLQIRGFPVRIPLDMLHGLLRQPRGLHQPRQHHHAAARTASRRRSSPTTRRTPRSPPTSPRRRPGPSATAEPIVVTDDVRMLVEEIAFAARESDLVDQTSGVQRACRDLGHRAAGLEPRAAGSRHRRPTRSIPRLCDLHMLLPARHRQGRDGLRGRAAGRRGRGAPAHRPGGRKKSSTAASPRSARRSAAAARTTSGPYARIVRWFAEGNAVTLSDEQPFARVRDRARPRPRAGRSWQRRRPRHPRGARLRRRDGARWAAPAPQARPPRPRQPGELQGDGQVPAAQAQEGRRGAGAGGRQLRGGEWVGGGALPPCGGGTGRGEHATPRIAQLVSARVGGAIA